MNVINKIICKIFGHNNPITFTGKGSYWCWSSGGYHCDCLRCGLKWESTQDGAAALLKSQNEDPRLNNYPKWLK